MSAATRLQGLHTLLGLELVITDGGTAVSQPLIGQFRNDLVAGLGAGFTYFQFRTWQVGTLPMRTPANTRYVRARVEIDWWRKLTDPGDPTPVIGSAAQGFASPLQAKYGSDSLWRAPSGFLLLGGGIASKGLNPDVAPEIGIERLGHIFHWWTYAEVLLFP